MVSGVFAASSRQCVRDRAVHVGGERVARIAEQMLHGVQTLPLPKMSSAQVGADVRLVPDLDTALA